MLARQSSLRKLALDLRAAHVDFKAKKIARSLPPSIKDLTLSFFNSELSGASMDVLSASLPKGLRSLGLNIDGCSSLTRKNVETLLRSLPGSLVKLHLEIEWKSLSGIRRAVLPPDLETPCRGSFATCFAQALQALRKLRSFKLNFELCEFTLNSAALIAGSLPASLRKLQFDAWQHCATVCVGVRFTRLQYARLKSLRCQLPQRFGRQKWRAPKGLETSVSEKAMQLGAMLCAGLEAAYLQGPRSATATLRWSRLPSSQACPWTSDSAIQKHLQHGGTLERASTTRAFAQQHDLDEAFREAFLRVYEDRELLAAVDLEAQWRDRDDLEEWLQVTPEELDREMKVRQEEFDRFDQKRAVSQKTEAKEPAQGASAEERRPQGTGLG
eukprot:s3394_g2.t1